MTRTRPDPTSRLPQPDLPSPRERWEAAAEWPLTAVAVLFLAAYAWPILDPEIDTKWYTICRLVTSVAWGLFVFDYVARLYLSRHRSRFVRKNLLDLLVVALPLLRPLRLLRLLALLQVLNRYVTGSLRGRVATYVVGATTLVLLVAALAVLDAERGHKGANIATYHDALWWALTTVTTVGYGDHFPVTGPGRLVAGGLMLAGIALLGIVTATLASWLIDRVRELEAESRAATHRDVLMLAEEIAQLRRAVVDLAGGAMPVVRQPTEPIPAHSGRRMKRQSRGVRPGCVVTDVPAGSAARQDAWLTEDMLKSRTRSAGIAVRVK